MARSRRGSFGLQPRVVPNVSGQIIALAREYVAKRDSLIMDAWKNGGTFEGKKVTDDMALAYWKERETGLDPQDPESETAKNQIMQLEYGIAQSKADVLHLQGKLSDGAYAQFFLKWAKKVPGNSEFYRTLQKDAAQLIESGKAKAKANGEKAKVENFNAFVDATTKHDIAIGDAMTAALLDLSKRTGMSITGNGDELLSMLTKDITANPDTYRLLLDAVKQGDPSFDGNFTEGYFTQHLKAATQGYELIADRAKKDGFMPAYTNAAKGAADMSTWGQNVQAWPIAATYTTAENAFLRVWNDPNASQMEKQAAAGSFSAQVTQMAGTPGVDPGSRAMLEADAKRLLGQDAGDAPSFGSSILGRSGIDPKITAQLDALSQVSIAMQANPLAWAYGPVDKKGEYDPTGLGPIGMVPAGAIPPGAQAVMVPGADGKAVMAMVMPHSVYTTDPNNPTAAAKRAGYQISYNVGGRSVEMWLYQDSAGHNHWSLNSPLSEGATTKTDAKGDVYVTPVAGAATDPIARAVQLDKMLGTHIADQLRQQQAAGAPLGGVTDTNNTIDKKGHTTESFELSYSNGVFTAKQTNNTLDTNGHVVTTNSTPLDISVNSPQAAAFRVSALSAGDVPDVTFNSPLQASVKAASYAQASDQVSRFSSDPAFQQAFLTQTMATLRTADPFDQRIADAWNAVTTPSPSNDPTYAPSSHASERTDLSYPGQRNSVTGAMPSINFGHGDIRLPGLPSYLQNVTGAQLGAKAGSAVGSTMSTLLAGLGAPGQLPAGSPAPSVVPRDGFGYPLATPTPTPTPSIATGAMPTPSTGPTSTPVLTTSAPSLPQPGWRGK